MSSQIKAVIFDQGGVLSRGGGAGTNEKAAARAMGLRSTIVIPDLVEDLKLGQISNAQFVEEINRRYPDAPQRLTHGVWDDIYKLLKRDRMAYAFVDRCRYAGLRVGLLSNINLAMVERFRADGSYNGFDPLVLSCCEGCAKPDPAIYAVVEAGLPGIKSKEILLLDDQDKCVAGALRRGWQAIKVTSPQQMVRSASKLLELG